MRKRETHITTNNKTNDIVYELVTVPDISDAKLSTRVVFPISVGEPYHSGEELKKLLKFVKHSFPNATILIADTLHRFNYLPSNSNDEPKKSMETATTQSLNEGNLFMQEYAEDLVGLNVYRWEEWKKKYLSNFEKAVSLIDVNYQNDEKFHDLIKNAYNRLKKKTKISLLNSIQYQKEEYAVILSMAEVFNYIVYPRDVSGAWAYLYKLFGDKLPAAVRVKSVPKQENTVVKKKNSESDDKKHHAGGAENVMVKLIVGNLRNDILQILGNSQLSPYVKQHILEELHATLNLAETFIKKKPGITTKDKPTIKIKSQTNRNSPDLFSETKDGLPLPLSRIDLIEMSP